MDAESYVKAWNYTALSTNAQGASYFFSNIEGYDQLQAPEEGGKPAATQMSGLRAINPTTISVTLSEPFAIFPITLGYTAFDPLPEAFFRDPKAFGKKPIGNGPFKAQTEWIPGQGMTLARYDQYKGEKAKSAGVVMRVYTELTTAYTDVLAGNLDVLRDLPPDAYASAKDLFASRYIEQPRPSITTLAFPTYDKRFANPMVRKALSMAIDRAALTRAIFFDTRTPADSYAAPVVNGYRKGACGQWCEYPPEEAKRILKQVGFDFSTPIDLWFNSGAGHDVWMTAIGNMFRKIGLTYRLRGNLQFSEYLPKRDDKGMTGPFRDAWIMDYPSIYNFLSPIYSTAALAPAGSNTTFYSDPAFDAALAAGNRERTIDAANTQYQRAEDILLQAFPSAPLFYELNQTVWSKRVSDVEYDITGDIDLPKVVVDGKPVN